MKRPEEGGEVDPQEIFSQMFGGGELSFWFPTMTADNENQRGFMTMSAVLN